MSLELFQRQKLNLGYYHSPRLAIVSESEKAVYREIEETEKKERIAKRDEW